MMLALKTLTVGNAGGKTLIFDEVDAGIGGRVADVVGARLRGLGDRFQVLCISHLPQIAARGSTHYHIDKALRRGRTVTSVTQLDEAGRVNEIARMIGGSVVGESARTAARDLLERRDGDHVGTAKSPTLKPPGRDKAKGESERLKHG